MKRRLPPILGLWLLIAVALVIFIGLSLSDDINIGDYTVTKARFPETLLAGHEKEELPLDTLPADTIPEPEPVIMGPDTTVRKVLVFGDSMTHYLAMAIARYGEKNNYSVTGVTWESSSIIGWNNSDKLEKYLEMTHPDFVFIVLGANELYRKSYDKQMQDARKIINRLGDIPYIWVGPALWKKDKGFYVALEETFPGHVFKADENIPIARARDHIHPTPQGARVWADTLMRWVEHSYHPIPAEVPDSDYNKSKLKFIYLHLHD